jgi:hypothetical protein
MSNGSGGVPGAVKVVMLSCCLNCLSFRRDHYSIIVVRSTPDSRGIMIHMHSVGLILIASLTTVVYSYWYP